MKKAFLYITLFVTGAVILVVEIAGTRVIAPLYGSSIYVWSILITVTLAALAVGYFLGGRLADKRPEHDILYGLILAAGLILMLVTKLDTMILAVTLPFGFFGGALAAAAILFGPLFMLLATATPFAIRLATQHVREIGGTSGGFYAVSTIGSIAGALITGFVLLPNLGVSAVLFWASVLLVALSLLWFATGRHFSIGVLGFAIASILFFLPGFPTGPIGGISILHDSSSFYGRMMVVERDSERYLLVDGISQSGIDIDTRESTLPYTRTLAMSRFLTTSEPKSALMIGLGGGLTARDFVSHGIKTDVVEIEPRMAELAERFFDFPRDKVSVVIGDGRRYLLETDTTYDIIVLDAFGAEQIPEHLITREAFSLMKQHLNPGGVLAINTWTNMQTPFVPSIHATLLSSFRDIVVLAEHADGSTNALFFAGDMLPKDIAGAVADRCESEECIAWYIDVVRSDRFDVGRDAQTIVLSDDFNPTFKWQQRASEDFRRMIIDNLSGSTLIL